MVIDFHSHILPAIDDGSRHVDMSIEMLKAAKEQQVDVMLASPHFYASSDRIDHFLKKRKEAFELLLERIQDTESKEGITLPKVIPAAEIAYFKGISRADHLDSLMIGDSDYMLVEMPYSPWDEHMVKEVCHLAEERHIVLAHMDRYMKGYGKGLFDRLLNSRAYVQINAESFESFGTSRKVLKLFKEGKAHVLGSDCHSLHRRPPNLAVGRNAIETKLGSEYLKKIDETAKRLLCL